MAQWKKGIKTDMCGRMQGKTNAGHCWDG